MFAAMGALHPTLVGVVLTVPRPLVATYGPPSTLLRLLRATETAVRDDPEAASTARRVRALVGRLRAQWVPDSALPVQLIHGDIRLGNVCLTAAGGAVYFDF